MKKIKNVKISPGCIACGTCAVVCPKVFHVNSISQIKEDIDLQEYVDCIKESADMCPVNAIEVEWDE